MTNHRILAYAQFWTKPICFQDEWCSSSGFLGIPRACHLPCPQGVDALPPLCLEAQSSWHLARQRPDVFSGFLRNFGRHRKTCSMMFTTYSQYFSIYYIHILIISIISYHIQDLWSYTFNIFQYYIHNLFKTSRVRFSRRETNGRSSTSDFAAATTSGSSMFIMLLLIWW